jgi:hypothetical protein
MQSAAIAGAADPQLELNESEKQFHDDKLSPRYSSSCFSPLSYQVTYADTFII